MFFFLGLVMLCSKQCPYCTLMVQLLIFWHLCILPAAKVGCGPQKVRSAAAEKLLGIPGHMQFSFAGRRVQCMRFWAGNDLGICHLCDMYPCITCITCKILHFTLRYNIGSEAHRFIVEKPKKGLITPLLKCPIFDFFIFACKVCVSKNILFSASLGSSDFSLGSQNSWVSYSLAQLMSLL